MKKKDLILTILVMFIFITNRGMGTKNHITEATGQVITARTNEETQIKVQPQTQNINPVEKYLKSKGHQEFIVIAKAIQVSCEKYNLPFEIILAISILESGYGTSNIAKTKLNYFGIRAYDWDPFESASDFSDLPLEEAIDYQILILKRDYFSKFDTLEEIAKEYCKNWEKWLDEIKYISKEIKEKEVDDK